MIISLETQQSKAILLVIDSRISINLAKIKLASFKGKCQKGKMIQQEGCFLGILEICPVKLRFIIQIIEKCKSIVFSKRHFLKISYASVYIHNHCTLTTCVKIICNLNSWKTSKQHIKEVE